MSDESALLAAIRSAPSDDAPRLVYADWLDERGRPGGAYLRAECRPAAVPPTDPRHADLQVELRAAGVGVDPAWLAAVGRAPIENCGVARGTVDLHPYDNVERRFRHTDAAPDEGRAVV